MRASAVLALLLCLLSAAAAATVERPARRLLADEVVERDDTTDSAAALVTGFTAFDVDNFISQKLAQNAGEKNITLVYQKSFSRMCTAVCPGNEKFGRQALIAGRRILELCDNCWCRQNRVCTVSPAYELCMTCMDAWAGCAPDSAFDWNANNTIRPTCAAKKPTDRADALDGAPVKTGVITDGLFAGGAGR